MGTGDHDHYSQPEEGLVMTIVGDPPISSERARAAARPLTGKPAVSVLLRGLSLIQAGKTVHLLTLREAPSQSAERTSAQLPLATGVKP